MRAAVAAGFDLAPAFAPGGRLRRDALAPRIDDDPAEQLRREGTCASTSIHPAPSRRSAAAAWRPVKAGGRAVVVVPVQGDITASKGGSVHAAMMRRDR
jgi:hypothetical protein